MWPATTLAPSFSALEADVAAQLAPVRGIEWSQLRTDWHRYAISRADAGDRRPQLVESRRSRRLSKPIRVNRGVLWGSQRLIRDARKDRA